MRNGVQAKCPWLTNCSSFEVILCSFLIHSFPFVWFLVSDAAVKEAYKMETIADKVMKMRIQSGSAGGKKAPPKDKRPSRDSLNSSMNSATVVASFQSDLRRSSQTSSRGSSRPVNRPESVAQRILRERQEQNLRTRFMVDDPTIHQPPTTSQQSGKGQTLPLHLALRQSAAKHMRPKALLANGTLTSDDITQPS